MLWQNIKDLQPSLPGPVNRRAKRSDEEVTDIDTSGGQSFPKNGACTLLDAADAAPVIDMYVFHLERRKC